MTKIPNVPARKRQYRQYDEKVLSSVIAAIKKKEISINQAAKKFKIAKGTLVNRVNNKHTNSVGCPLVLSKVEEDSIVAHIIVVSEWGFPFDKNDLCHLTKLYLDKCQRNVRKFKDNLPTRQWASRFVKRHHKELSDKKCQNLKRNKAELKAETIQLYFDNLQETLTEEDGTSVPPHRIFNYDETNLSDDPGSKRCIFKRGVKYPERVMDSSKSSTSLMFCGSAAGDLLPPYVVYKLKHLYSEWIKGGPAGTRYNRSKSGWFDAVTFADWFENMFVSYIKERKLNENGKVVVIGDNLSSHFSPNVLTLCKENNISFACLPKNATHLTQPLDVAFYAPLKRFWRGILDKWKRGLQKKSQTVTKEKFPSLLKQLCDKIGGDDAKSNQIVSGFKKTGIWPFNPDAVISRLPGTSVEVDTPALVSDSVLEMLKDLRSGESTEKKQRKSKLNVQPGKSVGCEDLPLLTLTDQKNKANKMRVNLRNMIKGKKVVKGKVLKKDSKVKKNQKRKEQKKVTKKLVKRNITKKAALNVDIDSDIDEIAKRKFSKRSRKTRLILSDSDSDELVKSTKKNSSGRKEIRKNLKLICDSDSDQPIDGNPLQNLIRPSISQIKIGDYVLVEFFFNERKNFYVGMVKNVGRDVIGVLYLIKNGSKFIVPKTPTESYILPTQVIKVLWTPKSEKGKLIFKKSDILGFDFA